MRGKFDIDFAKLRSRFYDRANAQSLALEAIITKLQSGATDPQLRVDIRGIAHSLAGAGGTLGFVEISAIASELDELTRHGPGPLELASACRALISKIKQATL